MKAWKLHVWTFIESEAFINNCANFVFVVFKHLVMEVTGK
jgi:hypothetical protein